MNNTIVNSEKESLAADAGRFDYVEPLLVKIGFKRENSTTFHRFFSLHTDAVIYYAFISVSETKLQGHFQMFGENKHDPESSMTCLFEFTIPENTEQFLTIIKAYYPVF